VFAGKKKFLVFACIACAIVVIDQVTKYAINTGIPVDDGFQLVPGFLNIVHARNPGAAFGILADSASSYRSLFFVLVSVVAAVAIIGLIASAKELDRWLLLGYSCFFGGALGNLLDRIRFGEVVDFLDFHVGRVHWPSFNVADSMLCVGIGFFFIHFLTAKNS